MKRVLVPLLWLCLALTIVFSIRSVVKDIREMVQWSADTARVFDSVEVHRLIRDTVEALNRQDSIQNAKLVAVAKRNAHLASSARERSDSLLGLLTSSQTPSESLQVTTGALETLQVGYDSLLMAFVSLRGAYLSQSLSLQRLTISEKQAWADIDSLQSLIRRTPTCRKMPFLGIPLPKVGIGYAATTGGQGIGIGVMVPLSCR